MKLGVGTFSRHCETSRGFADSSEYKLRAVVTDRDQLAGFVLRGPDHGDTSGLQGARRQQAGNPRTQKRQSSRTTPAMEQGAHDCKSYRTPQLSNLSAQLTSSPYLCMTLGQPQG